MSAGNKYYDTKNMHLFSIMCIYNTEYNCSNQYTGRKEEEFRNEKDICMGNDIARIGMQEEGF